MTVAKARPENASLPLLDTDTLRTFVAIAENGSFTRAAHACSVAGCSSLTRKRWAGFWRRPWKAACAWARRTMWAPGCCPRC